MKAGDGVTQHTIDITGIELTPGKPDTCKGNGQTPDGHGGILECCCDECDYMQVCAAAGQWEGRQCE